MEEDCPTTVRGLRVDVGASETDHTKPAGSDRELECRPYAPVGGLPCLFFKSRKSSHDPGQREPFPFR